MRKIFSLFILFFLVQLVLVSSVFSQNQVEEQYQYEENPEQSSQPVYEDPTGVQVKLDDNGEIRSILSAGEAELMFGDRQDIRIAVKKSTMRAKAAIAKFLTERIKSKDTMDEIIKTVTKKSGQGNSEAVRNTVSSQVETIVNSADRMLTGVVTLLQDINKDEKFVKVVVGVKEQTIKAASKMSQQINTGIEEGKKIDPDMYGNNNNQGQSNQDQDEGSGGREIRKSDMYEEF